MINENQTPYTNILQICANSINLSNSCSNRWRGYKIFIDDKTNIMLNICIPNLQTITACICEKYATIYDPDKIPSKVKNCSEEILKLLKNIHINTFDGNINIKNITEIFNMYENLIKNINRDCIIDTNNLIPYEFNLNTLWEQHIETC